MVKKNSKMEIIRINKRVDPYLEKSRERILKVLRISRKKIRGTKKQINNLKGDLKYDISLAIKELQIVRRLI